MRKHHSIKHKKLKQAEQRTAVINQVFTYLVIFFVESKDKEIKLLFFVHVNLNIVNLMGEKVTQ